jgi:hypothetical protein
MLKHSALGLAADCAKQYGRPCGVLRREEGVYTVETHIQDMRIIPTSIVAIFWPDGKTLLNAYYLGHNSQGQKQWAIDV